MTLWGGRFEEGPSKGTWEFTVDHTDRRLLRFDIEGSIAHARMLGRTGIIDEETASSLVEGLNRILDETENGEFVFEATDEDVHTAVERRLSEVVGEVAGAVHTGRSRNDQVALDLRLYLRSAGGNRIDQIHLLVQHLVDLAEENAETIIPSYTHLQQAQVTTLGHHLLAYAWMFMRDAQRLSDALTRVNQSPLGAGASSGSSLPLDRKTVADELGFDDVVPNSLDAVGSRDFVAEYVFCAAQTMTNLSRLAEEIVIWCSREFGWARLSDAVSTGSSALPQKRNPDIAELIRGRSATVAGDVVAILALQKALPLAYNRDLQEDKRIVFHADDTMSGSLSAMVELLGGIDLDPPAPQPETVALDLAEALVRRGVPFREAHHGVGLLVSRLESDGRDLSEATIEDLKVCDERFDESDLQLLDPLVSLRTRASEGSGNPQSVRDQIADIRKRLL